MKDSEKIINNISKGKNLTFEESKKIFLDIMSGNMKEELIYNFLTGLSSKGETSEEIAGGVYILREKALKVKTSGEIIIFDGFFLRTTLHLDISICFLS